LRSDAGVSSTGALRIALIPSSVSQVKSSADYRFDRIACNQDAGELREFGGGRV
jgi:hypothetical protein